MSVNNAHRTQTERSQKGKPGGRDAKSVDGATSGVAAGWAALVLLPALAIVIILYCWAVEDPLWCLPGGPAPAACGAPAPPGKLGKGGGDVEAPAPTAAPAGRGDPGREAGAACNQLVQAFRVQRGQPAERVRVELDGKAFYGVVSELA